LRLPRQTEVIEQVLWSNHGPVIVSESAKPLQGAIRVACFLLVTSKCWAVTAEVASSSLVVPAISNQWLTNLAFSGEAAEGL
jgi:hypothetical protein